MLPGVSTFALSITYEPIVQGIKPGEMLCNVRWSKTGSQGQRRVLPHNGQPSRHMLLPSSLLAGGGDSGRLKTPVANVLPHASIFC